MRLFDSGVQQAGGPRPKERIEMTDRTSNHLHNLDIKLARRIDEIYLRFEADWREGRRPSVQDCLGEIPDDGRPALRAELKALERELRPPEQPVARPEASPSVDLEPDTARELTTIDEAPTFAPRTPVKTPVVLPAPSSVHEVSTAPPKHERNASHDQPTAEMPGHDTSGTPRVAEPTRIRYFGDHEILREIGRGGMGIVYEARQISLNRLVAPKMIRSAALATDDELRRFQNEAEAIALLDHPHIVPILEVGNHAGQRYFSMKLIGGPSLNKKLDDYSSNPKSTASLLKTAAEALHHARQRVILHRDLKPANVLVDGRGDPYVTDFGLAKRVQGDSELTQSGAIVGHASYTAPEQASGRRGSVTTASDVYGLGAMLDALLTGRAPFGGESIE
jgi:eukaryotic-like serine/threonine-protein kinase